MKCIITTAQPWMKSTNLACLRLMRFGVNYNLITVKLSVQVNYSLRLSRGLKISQSERIKFGKKSSLVGVYYGYLNSTQTAECVKTIFWYDVFGCAIKFKFIFCCCYYFSLCLLVAILTNWSTDLSSNSSD